MLSDGKNASDLVDLEILVESVFGLAVQHQPFIIFTAFENVAQFCHISSDLPSFLQRDSADIFRSRAVLTQGSELWVNNAGTQRKKEISEGVRHSTEA